MTGSTTRLLSMDKVASYDQVLHFTNSVRSLREGFATNFFWNPDKHPSWIEEGSLFYEEEKDCVLLLHLDEGFYSLFYLSVSLDKALAYISKLDTDLPFVLDYVCKGDMVDSVSQAFQDAEFQVYRQLFRMSHAGPMDCSRSQADSCIEFGVPADIQGLQGIFQCDFDALCEQIPTPKELQAFIDRQQVLVYRDGSDLAGFLIYELNGMTWYLRYWYTSPEHRGKGVGSSLFHRALQLGEGSKRQILWVISDNENAIKRYEHYGFTRETMNDFVMVKYPCHE